MGFTLSLIPSGYVSSWIRACGLGANGFGDRLEVSKSDVDTRLEREDEDESEARVRNTGLTTVTWTMKNKMRHRSPNAVWRYFHDSGC